MSDSESDGFQMAHESDSDAFIASMKVKKVAAPKKAVTTSAKPHKVGGRHRCIYTQSPN